MHGFFYHFKSLAFPVRFVSKVDDSSLLSEFSAFSFPLPKNESAHLVNINALCSNAICLLYSNEYHVFRKIHPISAGSHYHFRIFKKCTVCTVSVSEFTGNKFTGTFLCLCVVYVLTIRSCSLNVARWRSPAKKKLMRTVLTGCKGVDGWMNASLSYSPASADAWLGTVEKNRPRKQASEHAFNYWSVPNFSICTLFCILLSGNKLTTKHLQVFPRPVFRGVESSGRSMVE